MATVMFTGFETGTVTELSGMSGTVAVQSGTVRTGSYALECNQTTSLLGFGILKTVGADGGVTMANIATSYVRFYFRFATAPAAADEPLFAIADTATVSKIEIRLNSAFKLAAYDSAGALMATGATVLASGTWYRIEIKCGTGATAAWEALVNGVGEISGSGAVGSLNAGAVYLGKTANRNNQTVDFFYDDVLWSDSAYPGAGQCTLLRPVAAGAYQTWHRGGADGGTNYGQIAEVPNDGDATYLLSTQIIGDAETEAVTDSGPAGVAGRINSVMALVNFKRVAIGGKIQLRLRSGATDSDATVLNAGGSYKWAMRVYDADPATGRAWTTSGIDGAEVGAVENATAAATRLTCAYAQVDYTPGPVNPPASPLYYESQPGRVPGYLVLTA